jgi:hypothetical protein
MDVQFFGSRKKAVQFFDTDTIAQPAQTHRRSWAKKGIGKSPTVAIEKEEIISLLCVG